ncbi:MAG: terminase [Burkholderiales bacterium]|nr:terminase [Burkholderiales bacterium]
MARENTKLKSCCKVSKSKVPKVSEQETMVSGKNLSKVSDTITAKVLDFNSKAKRGRPTLYRKEYVEQAYKLCLLGATDKQLAEFFEVNTDTIYTWKKIYPDFSESIKRGKLIADAQVAESLYKICIGYTYTVEKVRDYKGKITIIKTNKHYLPNVRACIFWLRNRQPNVWGK